MMKKKRKDHLIEYKNNNEYSEYVKYETKEAMYFTDFVYEVFDNLSARNFDIGMVKVKTKLIGDCKLKYGFENGILVMEFSLLYPLYITPLEVAKNVANTIFIGRKKGEVWFQT